MGGGRQGGVTRDMQKNTDDRADLDFGKTKQFSSQHGLACVQNQNIRMDNLLKL